MSIITYKPIALDSDGVLGQIPDGSIINIGGTSSTTFTVGGKGLLFDDGSSTAPGSAVGTTLQSAYQNSTLVNGNATIALTPGKGFAITNVGSTINYLIADSNTGNISLSSNLTVGGLINGINIVTLNTDFGYHLSGLTGFRHTADEIDLLTPITQYPSATNVQEVLQDISTGPTSGLSLTYGLNHIQSVANTVWNITHNANTTRVSVTVYDSANSQIIPDSVDIIDVNNIQITFNSAISGNALLILF